MNKYIFMKEKQVEGKIVSMEVISHQTFSSHTVDKHPIIIGPGIDSEVLVEEHNQESQKRDRALLKYKFLLGALVTLFYVFLFAAYKTLPVNGIFASIASLLMIWVPSNREIRGDGGLELWNQFGYGSGFLSRFSGGATTRPYIMDSETIKFFGWCGLIVSLGYGVYYMANFSQIQAERQKIEIEEQRRQDSLKFQQELMEKERNK